MTFTTNTIIFFTCYLLGRGGYIRYLKVIIIYGISNVISPIKSKRANMTATLKKERSGIKRKLSIS